MTSYEEDKSYMTWRLEKSHLWVNTVAWICQSFRRFRWRLSGIRILQQQRLWMMTRKWESCSRTFGMKKPQDKHKQKIIMIESPKKELDQPRPRRPKCDTHSVNSVKTAGFHWNIVRRIIPKVVLNLVRQLPALNFWKINARGVANMDIPRHTVKVNIGWILIRGT